MKKIFAKIAAIYTAVLAFIGKSITSAYDKLSSLGKEVVPVAVKVVQGLKTFVASDYDDIIVAIIGYANTPAGKYASKVQTWLEKNLPDIAVKLEIIQSITELDGIEATTEAIMKKLQISENRGEKALALATELALYLSDGKLTWAEIKDAAKDYYDAYVKPKE